MSVLARDGITPTDPWHEMQVTLEDAEHETTPLNSPEKAVGRPSGDFHRSVRSDATAAERTSAEIAAHEAGRHGADLRRSQLSYILLALLASAPFIDLMLLLDVLSMMEFDSEVLFGEDTRSIARIAQFLAILLTIFLAAHALSVHRRWQISLPRHAAAAATGFALLPEYTTIALVLDVGKIAYPGGARVMLVTLLMLLRVTSVSVLLRLSFVAGLRRGLVSQRQMPEMLRTLVSLEGVEARGLGDVAPQSERPLSVDLLEKLIVFLTPRRAGERPKEGAGLARNSILPLTFFTFALTAMASFTDYERLRSSQEPLLPKDIALSLTEASMNETARLLWRPPSAQPVPPVSTFLVIVSGVTHDVGTKILSRPFDASVNHLCTLDVQTDCESLSLRATTPSTSLPNWIGALTGMSPTVHGVLSNFAIGPFPFDSVFAQAKSHGLHAGVSSSPWLVNPIKVDLPPLDGDGRTTSAADGVYETTQFGSSKAADLGRREATLAAVRENADSLPNELRASKSPSRYGLFVSQLTNVDSVGHRRGSTSAEYEDAMRDVAEVSARQLNREAGCRPVELHARFTAVCHDPCPFSWCLLIPRSRDSLSFS